MEGVKEGRRDEREDEEHKEDVEPRAYSGSGVVKRQTIRKGVIKKTG